MAKVSMATMATATATAIGAPYPHTVLFNCHTALPHTVLFNCYTARLPRSYPTYAAPLPHTIWGIWHTRSHASRHTHTCLPSPDCCLFLRGGPNILASTGRGDASTVLTTPTPRDLPCSDAKNS